MLWTRSAHAAPDEADLNISTAPIPADPQAPGAIFLLFAALVRPRSVGSLTIASRDPHVAPVIDPGFLTDPTDRERLIDGVEMIRAIARHAPLADLIGSELAPRAAGRRPRRDQCRPDRGGDQLPAPDLDRPDGRSG